MEQLFNLAALNGGYFNTAALEGGDYNTAALVGGSTLYDDAAVLGGFALSALATQQNAPGDADLLRVGQETLNSLPPTVRETINRMFSPVDEAKLIKICVALSYLYLLDSLKAISIAPEMDVPARNLARRRWIVIQKQLRTPQNSAVMEIYNRLLRYIHIPHHGPRACKCMRDRWVKSINNRSRAWGRSKAFHALPRGLSTRKYPVTGWNDTETPVPSVRTRKSKKRRT